MSVFIKKATTESIKLEESYNENVRLHEEYMDSFKVLEEDVFAKSKKLLAAEAICQEIINEIHGSGAGAISLPAFGKRIKLLEELLAEQFNFNSVTVDFDVSGSWVYLGIPPGTPNAFTVVFRNPLKSLDFTKSSAYSYTKTSTGYRFTNPSIDCYIGVTTELCEKLKTGGELLSIILHEIGHNFYTQGLMARVYASVLFIMVAQVRLFAQLDSWIFRNVVSRVILAPFKYLYGFIYKLTRFLKETEIIQTISSVASMPFLLFMAAFTWMQRLIPGMLMLPFTEGYHDEKFADNFATAHGYGSDLAGALSSLEFADRINIGDRNNGVLRMATTFNNTCMLMMSLADPHPLTINRIKNQLTMLQSERSKAPKKMRPLIDKEIKGMTAALTIHRDKVDRTSLDGASEDFFKSIDGMKEVFSGLSGKDFKFLDTQAAVEKKLNEKS